MEPPADCASSAPSSPSSHALVIYDDWITHPSLRNTPRLLSFDATHAGPHSSFLPPSPSPPSRLSASAFDLCVTHPRSFVEDIEINDLRNRYLLTKGSTQQQLLADTGCAVLTKGVWYPDKSMATEKDPPLYLHITAVSRGPGVITRRVRPELGVRC